MNIEIGSLVVWFWNTDMYVKFVMGEPRLMREPNRMLCAAFHRVEDPIKESYALQNL